MNTTSRWLLVSYLLINCWIMPIIAITNVDDQFINVPLLWSAPIMFLHPVHSSSLFPPQWTRRASWKATRPVASCFPKGAWWSFWSRKQRTSRPSSLGAPRTPSSRGETLAQSISIAPPVSRSTAQRERLWEAIKLPINTPWGERAVHLTASVCYTTWLSPDDTPLSLKRAGIYSRF